MKVVVVGSGIGGLVAARALAARHEVTVIERSPAFQPVGAGILLGANALAVLDALGIDVRPAGLRLSRMDVIDDSGAVIGPMPVPEDGPPREVWSFHRAELHTILVGALPPSVRVRLGAELTGLSVGATGVALEIGGESTFADVVVGADGLHSRVRATVHPDVPLRYSGQTCWRVVVPAPQRDGAVEAWGQDGARFGVVPLTGGRSYLFLVAPAPLGAPTPAWSAFSERFGAFAGAPAEVWPAVRPEDLLHRDLEELSAPVWGTPRAWLLGDAAHAMTPNLGQGAAMAIEDAGALALVFGDDPVASHASFVALRHERVRAMQDTSARMGQVAALAHPTLRWLRDRALQLTPAAATAHLQSRLFAPGLELAERLRDQGRGPTSA